MTADIAIRAEGLGKKYVIGHNAERERYTALRDVIGRTVRTLGRTTADMLRGRPIVSGDTTEDFWALRDLDFEIARGEVVGIIGRNGAGKSTLLKVLSRITEPTEGRVTINGRVASLLEVGTGFHPELSGRENIYLNGAILGMTRTEIAGKFDEIVAFAEVERFLDTPVKRYSSGMYVRLAFAVAAHLEPEILVVDEVLAVGDAEFQQKCLAKMDEVAGHGRTVLFVSHNMGSIARLCRSAILLRKNCGMQRFSTADQAVNAYLTPDASEGGQWFRSEDFRSNPYVMLDAVEIIDTDGALAGVRGSASSQHISVNIRGEILRAHPGLHLGLALTTQDGVLLYVTSNTDADAFADRPLPAGPLAISALLPTHDLNEGTYFVALAAHVRGHEVLFNFENGPRVSFQVQGNYGPSAFWDRRRPGAVAPRIEWRPMLAGRT